MKTSVILLILASLISMAAADGVKKQPRSRYAKMWTSSPFTVKPIVEKTEEINALDDWTLAGVADSTEGPIVMMMNKKDRTKRVRIMPGRENNDGYEVVSVNMGSNKSDTVVRLRYKGKVGALKFDNKLTALKSAPKQASTRKNSRNKNAKNNRRPPVPNPVSNTRTNNSNKKKTKKRPRVVRPRKR